MTVREVVFECRRIVYPECSDEEHRKAFQFADSMVPGYGDTELKTPEEIIDLCAQTIVSMQKLKANKQEVVKCLKQAVRRN